MVQQEYTCELETVFGALMLSSNGEALTGLWLEGQKYFGAGLGKNVKTQELAVFEQTKEWLDVYFNGKNPDFLPPLVPSGSEFRQRVWKILLTIPYGQVMTYGEIAGQIARERGMDRMSAQAVGQAVGHNPISIIIPCHRVVGSNGSLTGYGGGIHLKIRLLELEKTEMKGMWIPSKGTAI